MKPAYLIPINHGFKIWGSTPPPKPLANSLTEVWKTSFVYMQSAQKEAWKCPFSVHYKSNACPVVQTEYKLPFNSTTLYVRVCLFMSVCTCPD